MLIATLSGFIFALLIFIVGKRSMSLHRLIPTLLPFSLFVYFLSQLNRVKTFGKIEEHIEWAPSLGVNFDFILDGLSLSFAMLITGIGVLVYFYTSNYLKNHPILVRFYIFLSLFMGSMLGLVLSDNLITLFIFWELTSISSFFLIGFNHEDAGSRKSALVALGITGLGGMALLAFAVLMSSLTGTMSISEMLQSKEMFSDGYIGMLALVLILVAAFTKSAQFPFHFWLPGAMKAPTPVSTYLHSATMVKAGIYLMLRFSPHFDLHPHWNIVLITFGSVTMIYAALQTMFKTDLKGILAYSTIAALGILTFLIGIGTKESIMAAIVFVWVHALYKAGLFLITGIIDHQTKTRDFTKLSGLKKVMPIVFVTGGIVAFSSAGIPLTVGFIGKDLIYESTLHSNIAQIGLTTIAVLTNILMVYAGFLVGIKPFIGKIPKSLSLTVAPSFVLWFPTVILAALSLIYGIVPSILYENVINPTVTGLGFSEIPPLKIWHGFNLILLLSVLTIGLGILIYHLLKPNKKRQQWLQRFEFISPQSIVLYISNGFTKGSKFISSFIQNGYLRNYVLVVIIVLITVLSYHIFYHGMIWQNKIDFSDITVNEIVILVVMFFAIGFSVFSRSRLAAIAGMGVVGYSICFIFVFYSAPDLAMTQFSIDTLTVILFVLVLYRLPKYLRLSNKKIKIRDFVVSIFLGTLITLVALEVILSPMQSNEISQYYSDNAYVLAKGKNIVNVILVDFRGIDTMIEIIVLSIAAIGVFGLLKLNLKSLRRDE